jgi:hypothetical protein
VIALWPSVDRRRMAEDPAGSAEDPTGSAEPAAAGAAD